MKLVTSHQLTSHRRPLIHTSHVTFTGNENHSITVADAVRLTENYRLSVSAGHPLGGSFGRSIFLGILTEPNCVGIRTYLATTESGMPSFVLVGVDSGNSDLVNGLLAAYPVATRNSLVRSLTDADPVFLSPQDQAPVVRPISITHSPHSVTLVEASNLARNHRASNQGKLGKGGFFGKRIFMRILSEVGCVGITIYIALKDDGRPTLVLAGIDARGNHFAKWPFGDEVFWCPPFCAPQNSLNH